MKNLQLFGKNSRKIFKPNRIYTKKSYERTCILGGAVTNTRIT
jgi:hypothetical protein